MSETHREVLFFLILSSATIQPSSSLWCPLVCPCRTEAGRNVCSHCVVCRLENKPLQEEHFYLLFAYFPISVYSVQCMELLAPGHIAFLLLMGTGDSYIRSCAVGNGELEKPSYWSIL